MKKIPVGIAIATLFAAPLAAAQESGFSLKGFGTLGVVHSSSDEADYVSNPTRLPSGAGITRQTSFGVDSKLGLQADWKLTSSVSVTAQALSKLSWDSKYSPDLEWGFVKYSATSNLDVRAGRIRPAIYLLSDFVDVNYANPWVRPPIEFYAAAPISRMEGIDILWRPTIGDVSLLIQPYFGQTGKVDLPGGVNTVEFKKIMGFNATAARGDLTYRAGYIQTDVTYDAPALAGPLGLVYLPTTPPTPGLAGLCAMGMTVACTEREALNPVDKKASFTSLGIAYDNGEFFVSGEYGIRSADSMISDNTSYYVSGGMRTGKWTPYATYAAIKIDSPTMSTIPVTSPTTGLANAIVTALLMQGSIFSQNSISIGTRYDVAKNIALKAQWDRVSTDTNNGQVGTGGGIFRNGTTAFNNRDNSVKVISFALDFVF
jgi:hypothetical protein